MRSAIRVAAVVLGPLLCNSPVCATPAPAPAPRSVVIVPAAGHAATTPDGQRGPASGGSQLGAVGAIVINNAKQLGELEALSEALRDAHIGSDKALALKAKAASKPVVWVRARRLTRMPEHISHGLALGWSGAPMKSRRALSIRKRTTKVDETIRSLAYKACTSPRALAAANKIDWDAAGTPIPAGTELQIPLRFRAASGFAKAVRLRTAPGVLAERIHHTWGRPYVIKLLQEAFHAVHQRWAARHPFIVHDVSRFGGGRLGRHKSHRAGRDIDIGYPTRDSNRKQWGKPALSAIDYARLWFVVDRLERSGLVAAIYMSPRIQRRLFTYAAAQGEDAARLQVLFQYPCAKGAKRTLIRHAAGHRDHMHIRFASPKDLPELQS